MSSNISNRNYFKMVFQSGVIWALCLALFETFQMVTTSFVRYIMPWDVVIISLSLFLSYSVLWSIILFLAAILLKPFCQKREPLKENIIIFYVCIALFLYRLLWIFGRIRYEKLYSSFYGIFLSLIYILSAALISYAIVLIGEALRQKGYLRRVGPKLFAFGISAIGYMVLNIYLRSMMGQEVLNPLYSIVLLIPMFAVFLVLTYLMNQLIRRFSKSNFSLTDKKTSLLIVLVTSISLSLGLTYESHADKSKTGPMPNILLISIDTLRADHLSCYDKLKRKISPNIDQIAHSGYLFKRAYSTSSWTLPAHASMMTGLFPSSHGAGRRLKQTINRPLDPLPSSITTLAQVLSENGYNTAGIISNPFISSAFGMSKGFQYYDDHVDLLEHISFATLKDHSMLFKVLRFFKVIDKFDYDLERKAFEGYGKALQWLRKNKNKGMPFFLFLHFNDPHFIYEPPEPYNSHREIFKDMDRLVEGQFTLTSKATQDLLTLYDGEIAYVDHYLGLLFAKLKQWNLFDNTLIMIVSDHGESFNEHEVWTHGNRLYEEQIHVPFIIRYPAKVPGGIIDNDHVVQLTDVMPTILDIIDIPLPDNIQGRSLLPIFEGKTDIKFERAFVEIRPDIIWKSKNPRYGDGIKAVIDKEWKYILYDYGKEELYDLHVDPYEKNNLLTPEREKANEMRKILMAWSNEVTTQRYEKEENIDRRRLEQLRGLGYLE